MPRCEFHKQDGQRCRAHALRGSRHCFSHDPAAGELKKAAATKGGRNRRIRAAKPVVETGINSLNDLTKLMFRAVGAVNSGGIELDRARTIGYLAGVTAKLVETAELAHRVEAMEARLMPLIEQRLSGNRFGGANGNGTNSEELKV